MFEVYNKGKLYFVPSVCVFTARPRRDTGRGSWGKTYPQVTNHYFVMELQLTINLIVFCLAIYFYRLLFSFIKWQKMVKNG